ncbi:MAG: hypothetical protein J7L12_03565 [Desulfurococcales archaeon]|nr:hypothetical protein [Desulfurococcales archaeon]
MSRSKLGSGEELVIEELAKKLFREVASLKRYKAIGADSPHGIYLYDRLNDEWVLASVDGEAFMPKSDGYYIIYFDNTRCSACRKYDKYWFPYVRKVAKELSDHYFVIVLCEWFARNCRSESASKTFATFDVHASPTTYLLHVKDGEVAYKEKYEGYLTDAELEKIVGEFKVRAEKAERGEKVELPKKEEVDVVELLKKLLEAISTETEAGKPSRG